MTKHLYNPKNGAFTPYSESILAMVPGLVVVDFLEMRRIRDGVPLAKVLAAREGGKEADAPNVAAAASVAVDEPDVRLTANVSADTALKIAVERAEAGEANEFGETKRTFSDVWPDTVTVKMLDGVKDEELVQFAKHAVKVDYPEKDFADDAERKEHYEWMREDIRKRIVRIVNKRNKAKKLNLAMKFGGANG